VLSYDYTVLAGTQGALGHRKKDRLFELIERMRLPTVFFAEGGGGRPWRHRTIRVVGARHARVRAVGTALGRGAADRRRRRRCFAGKRG
jgi:acetyl-CoA carboxylase carboxyltransferase component